MSGRNGICGVRRRQGENRESEKCLHSGHEITTNANFPNHPEGRPLVRRERRAQA